jgi:hypothetical protein
VRNPAPQIATTVALTIALAAPSASLFAQSTRSAAATSIVKITCTAGGKEWRGTGFAWSQPTYVVTALHVVAGCAGIDVHSEGLKKGSRATLKKALRESDLALIELTENIGLVPLKTGSVTNPEVEHRIWGYPRGVKTMQGDEVRFSEALDVKSTLSDLMSESEYRKAVGEQGFPRLSAVILRVGSIIQPGHSGGPIFDKAGVVVGIGDGGLHEGIARINWAIPTNDLQKLMASNEAFPTARPQQVAHFSVETGESEPPPIQIADGEEFSYSWSAPLGEIVSTASDEDAEDVEALFEDARKETGVDLRKTLLHIFEDSKTGATFAVPEDVTVHFDRETGMLEATAASERVTMYVRVADTGGSGAMDEFDGFLDELADWQPDPDSEDEVTRDEGRFHAERTRVGGDDPDDPDDLLFSGVTVEGGRFLGTAIVVSDMNELTKDGLRFVFLMKLCVELSGFAID